MIHRFIRPNGEGYAGERRTPSAHLLSILHLLLVTLLLCPALQSQIAAKDDEHSSISQVIEDLDSSLDNLMKEIPVPGAAVALVSRDSILWIGTYGVADLASSDPITEDTHFGLGSCTKSFTGLGFLKLVDDGKIDLNTPVREIAPEIAIDNPWADTHPVRIIHLLEHTAGFDDSHMNWFYFEGPVLPLQDALERKAHLRKVRWRPGTRFSYSSAGYTLAGYILEKVSEQPYEEYLKQALLNPIGMRTSRIGNSEECRQLLATGYDRNISPVPLWYDYDEPAGAMKSSIREMALFVQFMLNRGAVGEKRIISDEPFDGIARSTTTLAAKAGLADGYSFGVGTRYRDGARWYGHGGAVPGFLADYSYCLDRGLGFVVLQNQFGIMLYTDVLDMVWQHVTPLVDSAAPPPPAFVSASQLEAYCGYYEPRNPRMQLIGFVDILTGGLNVFRENDTLYTQGFMDVRRPLIPVSQNLFRRSSDFAASSVFTRTSGGTMVFSSRRSYYERTSGWKPWVYRTLVFGAVAVMLSAIAYSLVWIPIHIYKKLRRTATRSKYLRMRVIPLLAVVSLILGAFPIGNQTMLELGQMTVPNVLFFLSTLVFAGLSALSLFTSYRSFYKPVTMTARVYALLLSVACFGMTLYLGYWGVIGLRPWAY